MRAEELVVALVAASVRHVVIGVAGANYWARSGHTVFTTKDFDFFLPLDPANALSAWHAAVSCGLELYCGDEPLDRPRDLSLAERIVARQALAPWPLGLKWGCHGYVGEGVLRPHHP